MLGLGLAVKLFVYIHNSGERETSLCFIMTEKTVTRSEREEVKRCWCYEGQRDKTNLKMSKPLTH